MFEHTKDFVFRDGYEGRDSYINALPEYDITCEKIKGTILKLNVPEDKWNTDEEGNKYLAVNYIQDGSYIVKRVNHERVVYDEFISQD